MGITNRQWPLITVLLVIIGTAVLMSSGYPVAEEGRQRTDLAQVQEMLSSSDRTAEYRLIPESVMTGLCWINAEGVKEGLFKDVNAGMSHWRERQPLMSAGTGHVDNGVSIDTENSIDYAQLSNELDRLSFVATGYHYYRHSAEITGILTIADNSHQVTLMVDLPKTASQHIQKDRIELTASTLIDTSDYDDAFTTVTDQSPGLCIAMQAAKKQMLPNLSSGQPLTLSQYY